jgi:putative endonuclease
MFAAINKLLPNRAQQKPAGQEPTGPAVSESEEVAAHIGLGRRGEKRAVAYLERAGYRLVGSNFVLPIGRNARGAITSAEIDIVAYDGPTLCFIEVKTRASDWFAPPQFNVDLRKQRQIARAARAYRRLLDVMDGPYRYDVLSLVLPASDDADGVAVPSVNLLKNFWSDSKFRKRRWSDPSYD